MKAIKNRKRIAYFSKYSIRTNLITCISLFMLLPLCIALIILGIYLSKVTVANTISTNQMLVTQVVSDTDNRIQEINYVISMLMVDQNVLSNIRIVNQENDTYLNYQARKYISQRISELESSILNAVKGKISILTSNGYLLNTNNLAKANYDYSQYEWYQNIIKDGRQTIWEPRIKTIFKETNKKINEEYDGLYYGRTILDYNNKSLGVIFVNLSGENIWNNYMNSLNFNNIEQKNKSFYVFREDKKLQTFYNGKNLDELNLILNDDKIWTCKADQLLQGEIKGKYYYMAMKSLYSPNIYLFVEDVNSFFSINNVINRNITFAIVFIVVLTFSILIAFSKAISSPLLKLINDVEHSQNGLVKFKEEGLLFKEIKNLVKSYNDARKRILELIENVKEESRLKEKAHYEVLFSQISPHFIFNTINSIKWMTKDKEDVKVFEALEALGNILYSVYGNKSDTTTIGNELKLLNSYIKIMKMRFQYSFEYIDIIPIEFYDYEIPIFSLQPLIENAILHGVRCINFGQIVVSAIDIENNINISVFNNGNRVDEKDIDMILEDKSNKRSNVTGIGLYNINSRLKILYGDQYGLTINKELRAGFEVNVHIPKKRKEVEDENGQNFNCRR